LDVRERTSKKSAPHKSKLLSQTALSALKIDFLQKYDDWSRAPVATLQKRSWEQVS